MLEWLCEQMMEAEVSLKLNADKSERSDGRSGYRSGYRPRRLDTRLGTIYLMVPKVRQGGYIPFFVNAYKRSEAALVEVVQEAYINGVSTRKIERPAKQLGIEGISRSQVSDANKGLVSAVKHCFPGASWQRCKVHFMRNILAHIPQKQKKSFASELKSIWLAPDDKVARERANALMDKYESRYPQAVKCLEDGLEDSLIFYSYPKPDKRKISSSNMIERLNREIRRRTSVVGIFPNESSYVRLVTAYLMEYSEDWSTSRAYIKEESTSALLPKEVA